MAADEVMTEARVPCNITTTPSPASLLLAYRPQSRRLLVIGSSKLAASRARTALETGAVPVLVGGISSSPACDEVIRLKESGQLIWKDISERDDLEVLRGHAGSRTEMATSWGVLIDELDGEDRSIFAVCVTDTLHDGDENPRHPRSHGISFDSSNPLDRAALLVSVCRRRRIPINVADKPALCDFSFPATHRFPASVSLSSDQGTYTESTPSPSMSSLQIAVTTNGRGCRLAGRIRREIVSSLPRNVGDAVERVGEMRDLAKGDYPITRSNGFFEEAAKRAAATSTSRADALVSENCSTRSSRRGSTQGTAGVEEDDLNFDSTPLNSPVPQLGTPSSRNGLTPSSRHGLPTHSRQHSHSDLSAATRLMSANIASNNDTAFRIEVEDVAEKTKRRMRWVAQISEYWPIEYLGSMDPEQMREALRSFGEGDGTEKGETHPSLSVAGNPVQSSSTETTASGVDQEMGEQVAKSSSLRGRSQTAPGLPSNGETDGSSDVCGSSPVPPPQRHRDRSQHSLSIFPPPPPRSVAKGHIYLIGSGPGHPGLLTLLGHRLLTSPSTHLVLSDKLVPAPILRLIPSTTPLIIAKKFPGNAEGAQSELINLALKAALEEGKNVVRLKQGDPFVYGRGGEEVLAFRKQGVECTVVPGISSAIAAPLLVGVPVTQRGSADSLVLCTGVGRGGKKVRLPGYERGRSLIVLMGVARLGAVVDVLTRGYDKASGRTVHLNEEDRAGPPFPPYTPIAVIERASSSDQRLVASTLSGIVSALESTGEQRPPGMIVIGWSVLSLEGNGNVDVLDDERECLEAVGGEAGETELERRDEERVKRWLNGRVAVVKEGLDEVYSKALADLVGVGKADHEEKPVRCSAVSVSPNGSKEPGSPNKPGAGTGTQSAAQSGEIDHSLASRSFTGWVPGRYTLVGKPEGGWVEGEKSFR